MNITTDGSINGTPATMLVDTGAFQTILTPAATEPRKLVLRNTGGEAVGIGGYARIYDTRVDEFSIGPAKSGRMALRVVKEFGSPPSFDALVGAPFLLQADLEISLASKELKFSAPRVATALSSATGTRRRSSCHSTRAARVGPGEQPTKASP